MTTHIPHPDECATSDEALAAARQARITAAAVARREAFERGQAEGTPCGPARTLIAPMHDSGAPRASDGALPRDPATHRGKAPERAGERRKWHILHARGDELVARANELREKEKHAMIPEPNSALEAAMSRLADLEERLLIRTAANAADARAEASRDATVSSVRVGAEPAVYRADDARAGQANYLVDLYRSQALGDPQASERLARHGREVESRGLMSHRDITTSGVAAFVPPAYLVDLFAEYARAGRPVADLCTRFPLPPTGMTLNVPRITTPTSVAAQDGQNTATTESDPASTTLAVPVCTVAGYVDVSKQTLERGQLVEQIVLADLASAYNAELDRQILTGTGANGQHLGILGTSGINAVTFTDTSPTIAELWPKLADAIGRVVGQRFTGPTAVVMTPGTWAWFNSALSSSFPLIGQAGGNANSGGTADIPAYGGIAGRIMGVPVVLDQNLPTNLGTGTNESRIMVADFRDCFLFEDPNAAPAQVRFDGVGSATLTVRLQAYGYSAFTAGRRPAAVSVIAGTGLIIPTL